MKIALAYGAGQVTVDLPADRTTVLEPIHQPGLANERAAVRTALQAPIQSAPLRSWVRSGHRVCVVFSDVTRATPNERLIPWLLEELADVPPEQVTLLNSTGTHRPSPRAELERMLTPEVVAKYRVINHRCDDRAELVSVRQLRDGNPALLNRHLVEAHVRIITGFIEPHFFAGFSGGPKGIMPGCAGLASILRNHSAQHLNHPQATFGVTDGNPLWEELRDVAQAVGPSFLLNVTLNAERQITGVFAGDLVAAHRAGAEFVRSSAMRPVEAAFDVVVTSNSGYPLDQNLYQAVKGLAAAARIVKDNGLIVLVSECREGVPAGSPYERLLRSAPSMEALAARLAEPHSHESEQWQVLAQARVQRQARVLVFSTLPDEPIRAAHFEPCHDLAGAVGERLTAVGPTARVAVLPYGPLTIPYLA